jgi:photosystem II stability/assembly factor-like uncharacterized protein
MIMDFEHPKRVAAAMLLGLSCIAASAPAPAQAPADGASRVKLLPAPRVAHAVNAELLAIAEAGRRLVAVGDHGVVLLSDDVAATWRQATAVPVDAKLNAVSFVDEKEGWAVGHWGSILHTRDGGETWEVQRSATEEDRPLFAVHFFDGRHGVAVGLWSLVLVTEDGGKTWEARTPAPPPGGKKADLNLLGLFGDDKGRLFAVAERGMVLVSEDRGHAWRYLDTGYKGSFWTGAALPDGVLLAAGLRGSIYRSDDDGRTWTRIETGSKASITALAARSNQVLAVGLDGSVLRSHDGGSSFESGTRSDRAAITAASLLDDGTEVLLSRSGPIGRAASR